MIHHPFLWVPNSPKVGSTPLNLITTAASLHLGQLLHHHHHHHLGFLLQSSFERLSHLSGLPKLKHVWCEKVLQWKETNFVHLANDGFASSCSSCMAFFNGGDSSISSSSSSSNSSNDLETSGTKSFGKRPFTNALLAINVLIYVAQIASQGKLLLWGAKINSLIDRGQFWRLVTSSFLHANIGHLMVNCYSLNSVGPSMENICGPKRYLAVYFTSAIASSAVSYWFSKSPAVGASGAIFGLVGSSAVFVMRHRHLINGGKEDLRQIAQVVFINMVLGMLSKRIDNWGHLGGLIGGAATSWLLGPVWKFEPLSNNRRILVDRAPIGYLIKSNRETKEHR
ncbi:Rhomboid domain-containing protein [Cephalotus follicularis]|uniref:Rhomboid domain-containing protein n=1 Tax=Cephalotus follicularis TaxID=3775 RepID=A0A1Q3B063_CEPFO|nr:Rhomboid domain-containing protein [Cephalotus follicularis]